MAFATIVDSNVTSLIAGIRLADLRFRSGARLCCGALLGHYDVALYLRDCLAQHGELHLRSPEEVDASAYRSGLAPGYGADAVEVKN